jgi:thiol:disulfide interchange protein
MRELSRPVRRPNPVALVVLALSLGAGHPGPGVAAPPRAKGAACTAPIDFTVTLAPQDPFADGNGISTQMKEGRPGSVFRLVIAGKLREGFHTYPLTCRTAAQDEVSLSSLRWDPSEVFQPLWPIAESPAKFVDTGIAGVWLEHSRPFTWTQDVLVKPAARAGTAHLRFTIRVQVCNDARCAWSEHPFDISLEVATGPAEPLSAETAARLKVEQPEPAIAPVPAAFTTGTTSGPAVQPPESSVSSPAPPAKSADTTGLLAFVLQGILWGAVSLLTPCVFPMIPITVSFFLKQSEKEHHRPVAMASVYCATIIVVLTASAVALLSFFTQVSTHPLTNFGMGALFVFFALSLFGLYEIELPHSLAQFTSAREGKGGVVGTIFMALTFTIISFACVAPFLGGFGGTSAESGLSWSQRILGGLGFSTTFAAPFFLLALFPSLLKRLPKSGSWLNSVKVVMGFLELAAALKFCRAGERVWLPETTFFTFDLVLSLYVGIAVLCGLYLLGVYRLPHDTPNEHLGVLRMLFALGFLGLGAYLAPGLVKAYDKQGDRWANTRPGGSVYAWVASFLLSDAEGELPWLGKLDSGLARAQEKQGLVFVDFTGVTCTNCDYNESNVFTQPAVRSLLEKYTLVKLYTDRVPNKYYSLQELAQLGSGTARQKSDARANRNFQAEKFNDTQLPLYAILQPSGGGAFREIDRYAEGKINDPEGFVRFLQRPLGASH